MTTRMSSSRASSEARTVDARLDGNYVAGNERAGPDPQYRGFVDLEADSVAEGMVEAVVQRLAGLLGAVGGVAGPLDDAGGGTVHRAGVSAVPHLGDRRVKRFLDYLLVLSELGGGRRPRTCGSCPCNSRSADPAARCRR